MHNVIYFAPFMAILFWIAFVLLLSMTSTARVLTATVALDAALYWTAQVIARLAFGYDGPGLFFSTWGILFFLHTGFALFSMAIAVGAYNDRIYDRLSTVRNALSRHTGPHHPAETGTRR